MQSKQIVTIAICALSATAIGGVYLWMDNGSKESAESQIIPPIAPAPIAMATGPETMDMFEPEPSERRTPQANRQGGNNPFGMSSEDMAARLAQFDADGDGILSEEERDAMRRSFREQMLARLDTDGDGRVSRDERRAAGRERFEQSERGQELMRQFDADGDGVLNEAEQAAMDAHLAEEREAQREERRARDLERYDLDGDGELSREERQAQQDERRGQRDGFMEGLTSEFDRDGDGQLSIEESQNAFDTMRTRREIDQFVQSYDSNGDGSISAADFESFLNDYSNQSPSADFNRDGVIDADDISAYRDMMNLSQNRP